MGGQQGWEGPWIWATLRAAAAVEETAPGALGSAPLGRGAGGEAGEPGRALRLRPQPRIEQRRVEGGAGGGAGEGGRGGVLGRGEGGGARRRGAPIWARGGRRGVRGRGEGGRAE
jgi:hypothetical protein